MIFTLREARCLRQYSILSLAKQMNVHPNTVKYWEKHPEVLTLVNAVKLSIILDIPLTSFDFYSSTVQQSVEKGKRKHDKSKSQAS